jgi:general secretion pathway protein D
VTSRQVLDTLVDKYALTLIENTNTQIARLAFKATKEPPVTRLIQLMYAQPTNVVGIVSNALSTGSIVLPDSRSGTLLIRAPQTEIEFVETLLEKLDVAPKQVLIEAQLIETQRNPQSFKGIDWSRSLGETGLKAEFGAGRKISTTTTGAGSTVGKPGGGTVTTPGATTTGEPVFEFGGPDRFTTPVASVFAATASGFNPNFAFLSADGLQAVLHFLNSDSDTRTLSTPRVVAMDNQETRLEVIQGIPIFDASEVVPQTAGPVISSTKPNYTNVGAILIVTPRVVSSNVALTIKPEISAVGPLSTKTVAGKLTQADTFTSSKIAAQVMVPNGSTLVMGGLSLDDTSRKYNKVPLLGDLPLVGLAFRKEEKRRNKRNLVIFVTPTIVRDTDFQPTTTEFLKTAKPPETEVEDSVFESGKPYDWKKSLKFLK